jgi:acyl-coenzyme A thioesterase PaaI-like protein
VNKKLPNASHCFVCGLDNSSGLQMSFYIDEDDHVISTVTIPSQFEGYPGVAHGGIVATILDETLARAVMAADPGRFMFTGRLTTRYRKPTPLGVPVRLVGKVIRDRGKMAECASFLYDPDGELCAEADGLLLQVPQEIIDQTDFGGKGWKVVPD